MARASPSGRTWQAEFTHWLRPFLAALQREAPRRWAPVYLEGLLGPGERKSVAPMAARIAPADVQQLHHFVATSPWATAPLERVLARTAQRLVGGRQPLRIFAATPVPRLACCSVSITICAGGSMGKTANS